MNEKVKKLLELVSEDQEFADKICNAKTIAEAIELAKEKGIELTEEDVLEATRASGEGIINDLDVITGSGGCGCPLFGGGAEGPYDCACVCPIGGMGYEKEPNGLSGANRCICVAVGGVSCAP